VLLALDFVVSSPTSAWKTSWFRCHMRSFPSGENAASRTGQGRRVAVRDRPPATGTRRTAFREVNVTNLPSCESCGLVPGWRPSTTVRGVPPFTGRTAIRVFFARSSKTIVSPLAENEGEA
jgi:hypothetical protein